MRLIVCAKKDLHGCIFLNQLLPALAGHQLRVLLSAKTRPAELEIPELAELAFLERALPLGDLFPLVDRLPDVQARLATFAGLRQRHDIDIRIIDGINEPDVVESLRQFSPDLIISARFSHIFRAAAIATARHGVVNIHPGALPEFAGLFAPMRSIADGRRELTCTLHYIDTGIDSGPVIASAALPYRPGEGLLHQIADIYPLALPPLISMIDRLGRGIAVPGEPQDRGRRRYRSLPDREEIRAFLAAGHRLWDPQGYRRLIAGFLPPTPAS